MAGNLLDLINPAALNMLLQPQQMAGAPNMLMSRPDPQNYPIAPAQAPMAAPAPQMAPQAQPQADPWQGMREANAGPAAAEGFLGKLGLSQDRKDMLFNAFLGLAKGNTLQDSLYYGAAMGHDSRQLIQNKNKTVEWLRGKGMDEQNANLLAKNPQALSSYLQEMYKAQEPQKPIEVNGQLVDPTTYQVLGDFRTPASTNGPEPTALMRELEAAGLKPGTPAYQEAILANNRPKGMMIESDGAGGFKMVQGADVSGGANLNVEQGKNTGFLLRAQDADKTITNLESQGTSIWNNTAGAIPGVGNFLRSDDAQKFDQAKRDFINAQLRQESGAVISPEEFKNAEVQYFPQPGDSPAVIEQKRQNRQNAIAGFRIRSGAGAQSVDKMQSSNDALSAARDAIARGAPRDKVIQRLQENGIDAGGL